MRESITSRRYATAPSWPIVAGLSFLFLASAVWPVFVYPDLELQDIPNHLARAFILLHADDPVLNRNYRIDWAVVPDLGWDLWALRFGGILPLMLSAKILVVTTFILGIGGCFAMARAFTGRWTIVPLLSFPFLLNGAYAKGFLSFGFGLSLSFWAIAWWAWIPERRWVLRLAGATLFATLLYIVHLYSFGIYGLFVLGFELQPLFRPDGRALLHRLGILARDGLQALPALILFLLSTRALAEAPEGFKYEDAWGRFSDISLMISTGFPWTDIVVIIVFAGILITSVAKGWFNLSSKVNVALALYLIAFLLLPDKVINTSFLAWRVVLGLVFVGIAAMTPRPKTPRLALPALLAVAFGITLAVPLAQIPSWTRSGIEKTSFLSAIATVPEGSKIFFAHSGISAADMVRDQDGAYHVASYAVMAKRALVQSMFAHPGQQVLRFRDPAIQSAPGNGATLLTVIATQFGAAHRDFRDYLARFDYVVLHGEDRDLEARMFPFDRMQLIHHAENYRLYRLVHP